MGPVVIAVLAPIAALVAILVAAAYLFDLGSARDTQH